MNRIIVFLLFLGATNLMYAQSTLSEQQVIEYTEIKNEIVGTYQIQMIDTRSLPTIELSLFKTIQDARQQSETVYLTVSQNCRVMIPSKDEIEGSGFLPLEYIGFIQSNK